MLHKLSSLLLKPRPSSSLLPLRFQFAKKKKNQQEKDQYQKNLKTTKQIPISPQELSSSTVRDIQQDDADKSTAFEQKYYKRSAELYDRYLQTQERPQLTTDNYQINFALVLKRLPIHLPYDEKNFNYYKERLNTVKQTPYYNESPSIVDPEAVNFYQDQNKVNPENYITHRNGEQLYAENSKFWRLASPHITDPQSIQNRSTSSVFLIVKTPSGTWQFPSRPILQKENFDQWRKNFIKEMTGSSEYEIYWSTGKPVYVDKVEMEGLQRGKGMKTFYYDGIHVTGIIGKAHEGSLYQEHLWVPKYELGKYFEKGYFEKTVRLAVANL